MKIFTCRPGLKCTSRGLPSLILSPIPSFIRSGVQPLRTSKKKEAARATTQHVIKCKGADDFKGYLNAKSALESAEVDIADLLSECDLHIETSVDLFTLKRCLKSHYISTKVIEAIVEYYIHSGVDDLNNNRDVVPLAITGVPCSSREYSCRNRF